MPLGQLFCRQQRLIRHESVLRIGFTLLGDPAESSRGRYAAKSSDARLPPLSLGELRLIEELSFNLRRLMTTQQLLVLVSDQRLVCCWPTRQGWVWCSAVWPDGSCLDGQPLQPEVMGELLADRLLDANVMPAQVDLLLPLSSVHWRVVDGVQAAGIQAEDDLLQTAVLNWPLDGVSDYRSLQSCEETMLVTGTSRSMLHAWIDVVAVADLPLSSVHGMLSSAFWGLRHLTSEWHGDLVWLLEQGNAVRLVLIRQGVPEVDRLIPASSSTELRGVVRQTISAWQRMSTSTRPLGWWMSLSREMTQRLQSLVDPNLDEHQLDQASIWPLQPLDADLDDSLTALEQLSLLGLLECIDP